MHCLRHHLKRRGMFSEGLFGINSVSGPEASGWTGDLASGSSQAERLESGVVERVVLETALSTLDTCSGRAGDRAGRWRAGAHTGPAKGGRPRGADESAPLRTEQAGFGICLGRVLLYLLHFRLPSWQPLRL